MDLGLNLGNLSLADITKNLTTITSQSGLDDTRFLAYIYALCAETCRKQQPRSTVCSIGNDWLKPWQNAAKSFSRKNQRQDLWNALFLAALHEQLWEDVRFVCQLLSLINLASIMTDSGRLLRIIPRKPP